MVFTEHAHKVLGKFRNDPVENLLLIQYIFFGVPRPRGQLVSEPR